MEGIFNTLLRILEFVIAFGLLVFLHELGHYLASKMFNIEVEEFGFGFPPRLVKLFRFRETDFTLNWIPFGAFVRPKGENDPTVPGGLASASPWARLSVLFGGPLMNLVTGVLIFSIIFAQNGVPDTNRVLISDVNEGSPAEAAGLQAGDIVRKINDQPMTSSDEMLETISARKGEQIRMTVERDGQVMELTAQLRANPQPNEGALGVLIGNPVMRTNWIGSVPHAVNVAYNQVHQLLTLPIMMIRGQVSPEEGRFVGPKGIYDMYSAVREMDSEEATATSEPEPLLGIYTLYFLGTISIALGFTNLLPIPALDGGRILFVLPEILFRRRVPAEYENMIHLIGFAALILLMIYVTTQDIINPIVIP